MAATKEFTSAEEAAPGLSTCGNNNPFSPCSLCSGTLPSTKKLRAAASSATVPILSAWINSTATNLGAQLVSTEFPKKQKKQRRQGKIDRKDCEHNYKEVQQLETQDPAPQKNPSATTKIATL